MFIPSFRCCVEYSLRFLWSFNLRNFRNVRPYKYITIHIEYTWLIYKTHGSFFIVIKVYKWQGADELYLQWWVSSALRFGANFGFVTWYIVRTAVPYRSVIYVSTTNQVNLACLVKLLQNSNRSDSELEGSYSHPKHTAYVWANKWMMKRRRDDNFACAVTMKDERRSSRFYAFSSMSLGGSK